MPGILLAVYVHSCGAHAWGRQPVSGLSIHSPHAHPSSGAQNGFTALVWGSQEGHLDVVKALVAAGADLNILDNVRISKCNQSYGAVQNMNCQQPFGMSIISVQNVIHSSSSLCIDGSLFSNCDYVLTECSGETRPYLTPVPTPSGNSSWMQQL